MRSLAVACRAFAGWGRSVCGSTVQSCSRGCRQGVLICGKLRQVVAIRQTGLAAVLNPAMMRLSMTSPPA
jgi:hypothetical protein